jgi:hypothetical protein
MTGAKEDCSMLNELLGTLSLVGTGGAIIIGATVASLILGVAANLLLAARYASLEKDIRRNPSGDRPFSNEVLNRIVREAVHARARSREVNTQAIIENHFQSDLGALLLAERFVRSATGLVIILGLLGTFYGLTLSIGRLIGLVTGDAGGSDIAQVVTKGLTQSLSGMSVAFSNSLFGIGAAVLLTILGIFSNVTDRRTAVMVELEAFVDRLLAGRPANSAHTVGALDEVSFEQGKDGLARVVNDFGHSVTQLEGTVVRFESALQTFAANTRDFKEFNMHLKDNVQRMSLSFADFSDALKSQVVNLKPAGRS